MCMNIELTFKFAQTQPPKTPPVYHNLVPQVKLLRALALALIAGGDIVRLGGCDSAGARSAGGRAEPRPYQSH